jgi:hypothetical protein
VNACGLRARGRDDVHHALPGEFVVDAGRQV